MTKPTLIMGRVETIKGGDQVLVPLNLDEHKIEVLEHQKRTAALIAAAYLYRDNPTEDNLWDLGRAAEEL